VLAPYGSFVCHVLIIIADILGNSKKIYKRTDIDDLYLRPRRGPFLESPENFSGP